MMIEMFFWNNNGKIFASFCKRLLPRDQPCANMSWLFDWIILLHWLERLSNGTITALRSPHMFWSEGTIPFWKNG